MSVEDASREQQKEGHLELAEGNLTGVAGASLEGRICPATEPGLALYVTHRQSLSLIVWRGLATFNTPKRNPTECQF